ncbi:MAG: 2-succinyl-5-enolpyruvyl-6-hydroxy-3-cyclohexene-1-carboxylic-acid synthase [Acidimicrobiia bacterium]|nr:2-succinyl-5-enolpyruvyl-6-hydroxy-3-cyclohexene-1-carboxylic-acid synthase [Acidimicrobiia bacterium]
MNDPDQAYRATTEFFAELVGHGVRDVVVSPGSRSTPLTVTADATPDLRTHVMIDERSAGFFALGLARAARRPVVLVCTSGTAAANYLPAVVEAHYSRVPLIVCTADRPPELRDKGAGQTIDQVGLYGTHVRWAVDLPVASDMSAAAARRWAARAIAEGSGPHPGPVHCNWPLREPLAPGEWPPAELVTGEPTITIDRPPPVLDHRSAAELAELAGAERGLIVVGPGDLSAVADAVAALSRHTGWPVLAEATSSIRTGPHLDGAPFLAHWDLLLRGDAWADAHQPEVVVRLGGSPTTKSLRLWLERCRPPMVLVDEAARFDDPGDVVTRVVAATTASALDALGRGPGVARSVWTDAWTSADAAVQARVDELVDGGPLLEVGIVRAVDAALSADATLVVSNSMPVRDVDGYLPLSPRPLRVVANRGASGIDGVTSTALGIAAAGSSTVLLTGDVALVHDIGGLLAGLRGGLDLTVVVPDNGGGGIFELLPVAAHQGIDVETLFVTPSRIDWDGLDGLAGLRVHQVDTAPDLRAAVVAAVQAPGIDVIRVPVDRAASVAQHGQLAALGADLAVP